MSHTIFNCRIVICFVIAAILAACTPDPIDVIGIPTDAASIERGQVLVNGFAACGFCHGAEPHPNSPLSGGRIVYDKYGAVAAANITPSPSGLAQWSATDFMHLMRRYVSPDGREISKEVHHGFEWLSDRDLLSILAYIRILPPVDNTIHKRDLSFIDRNTTGILETKAEVKGFVPAPELRFEREYGEYVVNHLARCASCHNTEATLFNEESYLGGGKIMKLVGSEKIAPSLVNTASYGLGGWSEDDVVKYLTSGELPSGGIAQSEHCPIEFYRNAPPAEIAAAAKFLKSLPVDAGS